MAAVLAAAAGAAVSPAPTGAESLLLPRIGDVPAAAVPRGVVATAVQDRTGFLWLATGDGLMRFDGYRLRPVEREHADPVRRNLGWIRALLAGSDGRVWIGTEADGLAVYDPQTDRASVLGGASPAVDGAAGVAALPAVRALAEDRDGSLWIGTAGGGLQRFDPRSGRFSVERAAPRLGALPDDKIDALRVDRQGVLWVGTQKGLSRRAPGEAAFEAAGGEALSDRRVQALHESADGRLWVGTQSGELVRFDPASGRFELLPEAPRGAGAVTSFVDLPGGVVWVGRMTGIEVRDGDGRWLHTLQHEPRRRGGLRADEVTTLLRDPAGTVWIAGYGLGLQRHRPDQGGLRVRGADIDPASPLAQPSARYLLVRQNGEVWVSVPGRGVAVLDEALRVVRVPRLAAPGGRALRVVDAMAETAAGHVWLAAGDWLLELDAQGQALRALRHVGFTHRLFVDRGGTLWVCAQDGLFRLAPAGAELQRVARAGGAAAVGEVFAIAEDRHGALWVGSASGLFRVAPGGSRLDNVAVRAGAALANPVVIGLLFDAHGTLWVDTAVAGLHHAVPVFEGDGPEAAPAELAFDRISARHGIVGRPYGANLMLDARGRVWTQQYVYDPQADRIDELTAADGKDFGTGWFFSHARLRDGRMVFGGSQGLLVVQPELYQPSTYHPRLAVAELRVNGAAVAASPTLQSLAVAPGQRSLSLEFVALDYCEPERLKYAYRLEGFDPGWIATGADRRVASYSNLDPGRYVLRVKATNRSGLWSPHELAIDVTVQPSWWQTPSAHAAGALLGLLGLGGLVQWRTAALRRRALVLEQRVRERTAELERLGGALREASLTDPLTGLRNRRFLSEVLGDDIALVLRHHEDERRAGRAPPPEADLVFFLVDVDHFKRVNDEHGHSVGDRVIVELCRRLRTVFRASDHLVRWGGEEFLVVARDMARGHAAELAERAREVVAAEPVHIDDGHLVHCTVSLGFACFPLTPDWPRTPDWHEVVDLADAALYAAKQAGRNGWVGVLGSGTLDDAALRRRGPASRWLEGGGLTVVRSTDPRPGVAAPAAAPPG